MLSPVGRGDGPSTRTHALSATRGCEVDPASDRERVMQHAWVTEGDHLGARFDGGE